MWNSITQETPLFVIRAPGGEGTYEVFTVDPGYIHKRQRECFSWTFQTLKRTKYVLGWDFTYWFTSGDSWFDGSFSLIVLQTT